MILFIFFIENRENIPLLDDSYQKLNHPSEEDITFEIFGYEKSKLKTFFFHAIGIFFLCVPYLIVCWYKELQLLKFRKCSLKYSDLIYGKTCRKKLCLYKNFNIRHLIICSAVKDNYGQGNIIPVKHEYVTLDDIKHCLKHFTYQHSKYIWRDNLRRFCALKVPDEKLTLNSFVEESHGLTPERQEKV